MSCDDEKLQSAGTAGTQSVKAKIADWVQICNLCGEMGNEKGKALQKFHLSSAESTES